MSENGVVMSVRVKVMAIVENRCYLNPKIKDRSCPFGFSKIEPRCQFCIRYDQKQIETKVIK